MPPKSRRSFVALAPSALGILVARAADADPVIIWQNGFESADTCAWTAKVPAATCDPEMVFVPAGEFTMGSDTGESDEQPAHQVYLDDYWIDRNDVTADAYTACVTASGCTTPKGGYSGNATCNWGSPRSGNNPMNCVDWSEANTFCTWVGKRLPSEAEWEKAARGDARTYPWGEESPTCDYAQMTDPAMAGGVFGCGLKGTAPVGSKPAGTSPYGALDMAGNVWQWVNDWYDPNYYGASPPTDPPGPAAGFYKVMRGGGWGTTSQDYLRSARRVEDEPTLWDNGNFGFRCARNP